MDSEVEFETRVVEAGILDLVSVSGGLRTLSGISAPAHGDDAAGCRGSVEDGAADVLAGWISAVLFADVEPERASRILRNALANLAYEGVTLAPATIEQLIWRDGTGLRPLRRCDRSPG